MRKLYILIFVLILSGYAAGENPGHSHRHDKFTKPQADSKLLVTDKGLFSVEMTIPEKRLKVGVNKVEIIIHDRRDREDVKGANITFTPWMSGMAHESFAAPEIVEKGNGIYTIENIVMVMGGHWEFRIHIKRGEDEDDVVFDFPNVKTTDKYKFIKAKTPAGFNAVIGMKNTLEELEPEIITENGREIKVFRMTVKDVGFELFPGKPMMGWGFNGLIPGPTIRVKEGDRIRIILGNESTGEHTMHIHGLSKSAKADGVSYIGQNPVRKGETYTYEFTVKNIGTSWYHCHVDSAHHVDMGMYGAFIVEPIEKKLDYDREYIMILDEWPTAHVHVHEGEMPMEGHDEHETMARHEGTPPVYEHGGEKPAKRDWYPKTYSPRQEIYDGFTINGRSFPFTEPVIVKEGERVLVRFINAGYQPHYMHTHSHRFRVVARDGSYVNEPQKIDTVMIGPGQRVDIILFADNPGLWPFHCHRLDHVTNEHIYPGGMLTFIQYEDFKPEQQ